VKVIACYQAVNSKQTASESTLTNRFKARLSGNIVLCSGAEKDKHDGRNDHGHTEHSDARDDEALIGDRIYGGGDIGDQNLSCACTTRHA
jgi:hypothetical protein